MKINVDGFDVYPQIAFAGTRGSYGADATLEFEFGESWDTLSRVVTFYPADGGSAVRVVLGSDTVINIPVEVMRNAGAARYVVSGVRGNETMISVTGKLYVEETLGPGGIAPGSVTPDVESQILQKVTDAENAAQEAARSCAACEEMLAEFGGDLDGAAESAARAARSAQTAETAANTAAQAASAIVTEEASRAAAERERETAEAAREASETARRNNYGKLSNARIGRASGTSVRLSDVSPIEHEPEVTLVSEGGGLVQNDLMPYPYTTDDETLTEVEFTYNGRTVSVDGYCAATPIDFIFGNTPLAKGRYRIGGFSLHVSGGGDAGSIVLRVKNMSDNSDILYADITDTDGFEREFDLAQNVASARIYVEFADGALNHSVYGAMTPFLLGYDLSTVTLTRYGSSPSDRSASYSVSRDGTVSGVTSLYPVTNLVTDTAGVRIDVKYNMDLNKVVDALPDRATLLWRNASPASAFGAQTITVNSQKKLDHFILMYSTGTNRTNLAPPLVISTRYTRGLMFWATSSMIANRSVEAAESQNGGVYTYTFTFSLGSGYDITSSTSSSGSMYYSIPLEIYGKEAL